MASVGRTLPVEELLLAWAYLDTNQPDKATAMWRTAAAWLGRRQELPRHPILGAPEPDDSRYSAFDWETWHELGVLRRELAPRFAAHNP
jgi:hypothetical protein